MYCLLVYNIIVIDLKLYLNNVNSIMTNEIRLQIWRKTVNQACEDSDFDSDLNDFNKIDVSFQHIKILVKKIIALFKILNFNLLFYVIGD